MTAEASSSHIKRYRPYFTPSEVERLSSKQRGKLSVSREERARQQACGFIDSVGVRSGFPRRTIATAQTLYMRFHLFFPYKDFNYIEVALSTLYVSSKLHDTLKKPRDIILASYTTRFPHLVKKGAIDPAAVDSNVLEGERKRVLSIERLVLETMCFKFGVVTGLGVALKIGKKMELSKEMCQSAWRVTVDCYRTPAPLSYPPHVIALGSLYTCSLLLLEAGARSVPPQPDVMNSPSDAASTVRLLSQSGSWESEYSASARQIDDVAHALLDLYITILTTPNTELTNPSTPSPVSPRDAPSPSHPTSSSNLSNNPTASLAFPLSTFWTGQTLTELKIHLRDKMPGNAVTRGWVGVEMELNEELEGTVDGMGKNDGTVRFLWDPEPVRGA